MNYEKDLKIDPSELDVEWLRQPALMGSYTVAAAEHRRALDKAEEALSIVKAVLDKKIRTSPDRYSVAKITESAIFATIVCEEEYQEALAAVVDARFEKNSMDGAVKAIDQRKTALENLVKLHGLSYFAGPSVPHNLGELEAKRQENADKMIRKHSKKKKR